MDRSEFSDRSDFQLGALVVVSNKNRNAHRNTHTQTHTHSSEECDVTIGNVKKSTDNRGHPVWVSKLDQGSRQADASLWLTLVLLFMNVF